MSNITMSFAIITGIVATVMDWASTAVNGSSHYSLLSIILIIIGIVGLLAVIVELITYQVNKKRALHVMITEMSSSEQESSSTVESRARD
ncbi:MAG: hypothetical protein ACYDEH_00840 [Acidimicrobiales bacterium]